MNDKRYRVRRSWFGLCILQVQINTPSLHGGVVDSTIRDIHWVDVDWEHSPLELEEKK